MKDLHVAIRFQVGDSSSSSLGRCMCSCEDGEEEGKVEGLDSGLDSVRSDFNVRSINIEIAIDG